MAGRQLSSERPLMPAPYHAATQKEPAPGHGDPGRRLGVSPRRSYFAELLGGVDAGSRFDRRAARLMRHCLGARGDFTLVRLGMGHRLRPGAAVLRLRLGVTVEVAAGAAIRDVAVDVLLAATRRAAADADRGRATRGRADAERRSGGAA